MDRNEHLENIARLYLDYVSGDDACSFDHHGYCQSHGWYDDGPCIATYIKEVFNMDAPKIHEELKKVMPDYIDSLEGITDSEKQAYEAGFNEAIEHVCLMESYGEKHA